MPSIRVAVLASGGGTDLQSIIDASEANEINAEVVLVVTNNPGAYCLERADKHGIDGVAIDHRKKKREEHERMMADAIDPYEPDLIVLAGYIRMLTPWFIDHYRNRMINIHPALLPLFGGPGMHGTKVHAAVLESGMKVSGCTVHFVDEDVDGGPIIVQKAVPVLEGDTPDTLQARVLSEEHVLLPRAVQLFAEGRLRIDGKRCEIEPR